VLDTFFRSVNFELQINTVVSRSQILSYPCLKVEYFGYGVFIYIYELLLYSSLPIITTALRQTPSSGSNTSYCWDICPDNRGRNFPLLLVYTNTKNQRRLLNVVITMRKISLPATSEMSGILRLPPKPPSSLVNIKTGIKSYR